MLLELLNDKNKDVGLIDFLQIKVLLDDYAGYGSKCIGEHMVFHIC